MLPIWGIDEEWEEEGRGNQGKEKLGVCRDRRVKKAPDHWNLLNQKDEELPCSFSSARISHFLFSRIRIRIQCRNCVLHFVATLFQATNEGRLDLVHERGRW